MITDDMIRKSDEGYGIKGFTILDDNYILIHGDQFEINLIEKTKRLRMQNVNYCGPIEYRESNGMIYVLEHRAHGMEMDLTKSENGKKNYMQCLDSYMERLRMLSDAPEQHFDKFFSDIEKMREEGIKPDVCSLSNLFYDSQDGFSFIDVYPCKEGEKLRVESIFNILLNGKFRVDGISLLPTEYKEEYDSMIKNLYKKITNGMTKYGYPVQDIKDYLDRRVHLFSESECISKENIQEKFDSEKQRRGEIWIEI